MNRNLLRAGALSCALMTSTAMCTQPALAQAAPQYRSLDANGVDLAHGDSVLSFTEAVIGSGPGALALERVRGGRRGSSIWDFITLRQNVDAAGNVAEVVIERYATAERFTGPNLAAANADGATLTGGSGSYVHTAADGTVTHFGNPTGDLESVSGFCGYNAEPDSSCILLPVSITRPDGTSLALEYELESKRTSSDFPPTYAYNYRLARVSNSYGYAIAFAYAAETGSFSSNPNPWFERTGATLLNETLANPVVGSVSYAAASGGVNVTDPAGRTWLIRGTGPITGIRRPGAANDEISLTLTDGKVTSATSGGVTTSYSRVVSGSNVTTTVTDALNRQTMVVSNLDTGRPISVTDALGRTTSYQYDAAGRPIRVTAPEGNYTQLTYDARGNVTETRHVAKAGSGVADIVTGASFDASCANPVTCNQPNSVTDARGNVTNFEYDPDHGGVVKATAPAPTAGAARPETRYAYSLLNGEYRLTSVSACATGAAPACVGTADETRSEIGYDAQGNVTSVTRRDGTGALSATQTMTYTPLGDVETVDGPLAGAADTSRIRYNGAREVIGTVSADPDGAGPLPHRASRNIIDAATGLATRVDIGTVASQSDADWLNMAVHQSVETDHDAHQRPIVQRLTAGGAVYSLSQVSYDALGRPECSAVRMNPAAYGALPASACSPGAEGSFGPDRIARVAYDELGRVREQRSAVGTSAEAVDAAITFTANGQVETLTDGENNRTTYVYDGHDRLQRTRYPVAQRGAGASSTTDYEELGYDPAGNVTQVKTRGNGTLFYSYDALNRLTFVDTPNYQINEVDRSYGYDQLGRVIAVGGQYPATFTYDALGRRLSEADEMGTRSSQYDAAGRRTRLTYADGFFVTYDYNVTGEMVAVKESGATTLASYGYDDLGRRASLTRGNGAVTGYGYDPASRLAGLTQDAAGTAHDLSLTFSYNPAGQIVGTTRSNDAYAYTGVANQNVADTHNGLNQVTASGGAAVAHDGNGNTSQIGNQGYAYTAENWLGIGGGRYFQSDGQGRTRVIHAPDWSSWRSIVHDGARMIGETMSGGTSRRYVHGAGVDEPLVVYEGGQKAYLHADERGSIVAHSDGSGAVTAINRYDEYGAPEGPGGAGTLAGGFGYTGQAWLPEIGMYDYKARVYNPGLAGSPRFMQPDPIGYGDGLNVYGYVSGDPINYSDPYGLASQSCDDPKTPDIEVCGKRKKSRSAAHDFIPPGGGGGGSGMGPAMGHGDLDEADIIVTAIINPQQSPNFIPPRHPPAAPPRSVPPGFSVRHGPPMPGYPYGYWKLEKLMPDGKWHAVDPTTGKPPGNVSQPEGRARTHVAKPAPQSQASPTRVFWFMGPIGAFLCLLFCESPAY